MRYESMPFAPGGEGYLGHAGAFRRNRMGVLGSLALSPHPMQRLRTAVPVARACVLHHPDLIHEVLVENAKSFDKSDMLRFSLWNLAGEGLFTSNGELWRRQRKRMAPLFTPKALSTYADDMIACAHRTCDAWKSGETLSLAHETTRLTMGIAGKTLFEADTFSDADEIGDALTVALDWTGWVIGRPSALVQILTKRAFDELSERGPGPAKTVAAMCAKRLTGPLLLTGQRGKAFAKAIRYLDEHVQKMIDLRRNDPNKHGDLLSKLLDARDDEGDEAMSDRQIRDEVLTLFVAGHETTATGLAWTMYLACRNAETYAEMQREADAVGDAPTLADLPRLGACLRAFKEALRLYPPVYMFGRDSTEDVVVGGYELPRRTNVMTSPWAMHHSPLVWPDPERFDPSRFTPENEAKRHRYAYLPFGAGPRICLGNHFAYMEAQLALAVMLRRFHFESMAEDEPEPSATLRPRHGVRMRVIRRG